MRKLVFLFHTLLAVCVLSNARAGFDDSALRSGLVGFASIPITKPEAYAAPAGTVGGTGGTLHRVTDSVTFAQLLQGDEPRIIEVAADLDLSFAVSHADALPANVDLMTHTDVDGMPNGVAPLWHPFFFDDLGRLARAPAQIRVGSNKTIYSSDGRYLRHGGLVVRSAGNVIVRNLRFAELWEWDSITYPQWDRNTWDFFRIEEGSHHVWVDHCSFEQGYDGHVDLVRRSDFLTISWCKFGGEPLRDLLDLPEQFAAAFDASWIGQQYNALLRAKNPEFLSDKTIAGKDPSAIEAKRAFVDKWGRHWKVSLAGNANYRTFDRTHLNATYHHNWWHNTISRAPRARWGNFHLFNNLVEGMDNGLTVGIETSILMDSCVVLNSKNTVIPLDGGELQERNCIDVGAYSPKDPQHVRLRLDGSLPANTELHVVPIPEKTPRAKAWHAVGDWWHPKADGMADALPYACSVTPVLSVTTEVTQGSGATLSLPPLPVLVDRTRENWNARCSVCHGLDGRAQTWVGRRWEQRDYTTAQQDEFSDADAARIISEGVLKDGRYRTPPHKDVLSHDEIADLVLFIRKFRSGG